jgi:hypothetical protein
MADLLVKRRADWKETLSQSEVTEQAGKDKYFMEKYNTRSKPGDIIEVGDDNHWSNSQHGSGTFYIVRVPGLSKKSYRYLQRIGKRAFTPQEKDDWVSAQVAEAMKWVVAKDVQDFNEATFRQEQEIAADKLGYIVHKRRYALDLTKLPQLEQSPVITIQVSDFLDALINKGS